MASHKKTKQTALDSAAGHLGEFLRRLRARRSLPLRAVAAATGMDQAHLSKAELGQRLPTSGQTAALARFFQQDPVEFEAHRIAEKFRRKHSGSPAAARAVLILHGGSGLEAGQIKTAPGVPRPAVEPGRAEDRSVIVMHAD